MRSRTSGGRLGRSVVIGRITVVIASEFAGASGTTTFPTRVPAAGVMFVWAEPVTSPMQKPKAAILTHFLSVFIILPTNISSFRELPQLIARSARYFKPKGKRRARIHYGAKSY